MDKEIPFKKHNYQVLSTLKIKVIVALDCLFQFATPFHFYVIQLRRNIP